MGMLTEAELQTIIAEQSRQRETLARIAQGSQLELNQHAPRVENATSADAEMWLVGNIGFDWMTGGGVTAADVVNELQSITAKNLTIHVHSGGGDLFEALAIYAAIKNHPAKVTTQVDGLAASAASIVVMAGDRTLMARGSMMMIHEPKGVTIGAAADHQKSADFLNQVADNMAGIYADHGGKRTNWRAKMQAETWYTDEAAVAAGLADEVLSAPAVENTFDLSHYKNVPPALAQARTPEDLAAAAGSAPVQNITINHNYGPGASASVATEEPIVDPNEEPVVTPQEASEPTGQSESGLSVVSARLLIDLAEAEVLAIA